jgi:phospholipid transport system substrate-binding protein
MYSMTKRWMTTLALLALTGAGALADTAPDVFVQQFSNDIIETIKADKAIQAGDIARIRALVDTKIAPHVNFQRMTAMTVGLKWRSASPEQQQRLIEEFKMLLVNVYSGALNQVKDQTVQLKPMRGKPTDSEVVVRTEVRGKGEPIQLDYRLEKAADSWKIYDVNVLGVWLVESYKSQFANDLSTSGIDGLISRLSEKNKSQSLTKS